LPSLVEVDVNDVKHDRWALLEAIAIALAAYDGKKEVQDRHRRTAVVMLGRARRRGGSLARAKRPNMDALVG